MFQGFIAPNWGERVVAALESRGYVLVGVTAHHMNAPASLEGELAPSDVKFEVGGVIRTGSGPICFTCSPDGGWVQAVVGFEGVQNLIIGYPNIGYFRREQK